MTNRMFVGTVAFTPDGKTLITAGGDQTIRLWKTGTWEEQAVLRGAYSEIWSMACSPDGKTVVSGGKDGTLKLWSPRPRAQPATDVRFDEGCSALAPDGRTFAHLDEGGSVTLMTLGTSIVSNRVAVPTPSAPNISVMAVTPGARFFAVAVPGGVVRLLRPGREDDVALQGRSTNKVTALRFSDDGKLLAMGDEGGEVWLWDTGNGGLLHTFSELTNNIMALAFSHDTRIIAAGTMGGVTRLWDLTTNQRFGKELPRRNNAVVALAFSPDGSQLATAGWDEILVLWDVAHQREKARFKSFLASYHAVAFSKDGRRVAAATGTGAVKLWDTATCQDVATLKRHTQIVHGLEFSDDGTFVAYTDQDLNIWRAPPLNELDVMR